MSRVISDQAAFLLEAKDTLKELEKLKQYNERLSLEEKRLEKAIASETKAINDSIAVTVKRRKEEIADSYDKEIGKDQDRLKKVKAKREKAKNQGIKERIGEETAELKEMNKELETQMKTLFRQNRVPFYCNSLFYYSLYFAKGMKEMAIFLVTVVITFLAIPCGIYYLIPERKSLHLAVIYFVVILLFGGIYFLINNLTKVRHLETLRAGRSIRNHVAINKKKIQVIESSVKRDKSDSPYDLANFDDEILGLEEQVSAISKRKQEAISNFENVTKNIIADEISGNSQERITQLENQYGETVDQRKETENAIKNQSIYVTDTYEVYVGREFLQEEKLNRLIEILSNKEAENITEAIQVYKNNKG